MEQNQSVRFSCAFQLPVHLLFLAGRSALISESVRVSVWLGGGGKGKGSASVFFTAAVSFSLGIGSLKRSLRFFNLATVSRCFSSTALVLSLFASGGVSLFSTGGCGLSSIFGEGSAGGAVAEDPPPPLVVNASRSRFFRDAGGMGLAPKSLSLWLVQRSNLERPFFASSCSCSSSVEASSLCFRDD